MVDARSRMVLDGSFISRMTRVIRRKVYLLLLVLVLGLMVAPTAPVHAATAKYVILLIGDGQGANQLQTANLYAGETPLYQTWPQHWMTTFPAGGSYDPDQAWSDFHYVTANPTDSAAAATAMYTGVKTANGRVSAAADGTTRLRTLAEQAHQFGLSVGAVTSVYLSHATPGAWLSHNTSRNNGFAIADEALWGHPNTNGTPSDPYHGGGLGPTLPPAEVLLGAGHPHWNGGTFVNAAIRDKLAAENGMPGAFVLVERVAGQADGGARLLAAAEDVAVARLAGLFGGLGGNLDYRLADGSGYNAENPTLAQMTQAALMVLGRDPDGFVLLVEGGAIDWAAGGNNMNALIGEVLDFNQAVQTVVDWVEAPDNASTWENTLVLVTGDHETGYLTAGPELFPQLPLGEVGPRTLALEKAVTTGRRASWEDADNDGVIDVGEAVYWAWNSAGHTNSLVPIYAHGLGAGWLDTYAVDTDPVRGAYLDNTDLYSVMAAVLTHGSLDYHLYLPLIAR